MEEINSKDYEDIAKAFQLGLALGFGEQHDEMDKVIDEIKKIYAPKTGHWVEENINEYSRKIYCSECGCPPPFEHVSTGDVYSASGYGVINKTKFCPNCGADMRKPIMEKIRCNTCKNNDDELSGECYECIKGIFDHYEPEEVKTESEGKE